MQLVKTAERRKTITSLGHIQDVKFKRKCTCILPSRGVINCCNRSIYLHQAIVCPFGFTKAAFAFVTSCVFVFFGESNSVSVHCSWTYKFYFSVTFSLKLSPTALFTNLKIILLQCFQFSVFNFNKISSIQTDPTYKQCM